VRLFNLRNDDTYQAQVKDRLVTRIRKSSAGSFELRALESLLIATIEHLEADFDRLQPEISDLLERLVYDQSAYNLLLLKDLSDKLESFEADAATVQSALTEVLNNDEDMAQMYLTNAHNGVKQAVSDHTDVQTLLESFAQQVTELDNRVQQLKNRISNIEEYMRIHFDSQRNKLMRFNLITSLATLSFGAGAMGASVFGMNLPNGYEHDPTAFYIVSGALAGVSGLVFAGLYRVYAKTKERIPRPFATSRLGLTRPRDDPRKLSTFGGED
jgi:magnesium transporter